ncbi:peptidase M48 [Sphingobacteriaceae bacterium]|nr:peptidase M48 [Sphingobacteriaceae bacterium]
MSRWRLIFLLLILLGGLAVVYVLSKNKLHAPLGANFSPAFQLLGKSTKSLNTALTRVMPINRSDEMAYGDAIAESYSAVADLSDTDYVYLNKLIKELAVFSKKGFDYRVFLISTSAPNAFALPGGVICVTKGLLITLKSEAQIISVLSHEMGHIERGHCFEAIKYELSLKKIKSQAVGQFADAVFNLFLRHSFSKTQENDADEYGYALLLNTKYNPMAFSEAFVELEKLEGRRTSRSTTIISDYLSTHPPLPLRISKFNQMAAEWWMVNKDLARRYVGVENLTCRVPLKEHSFPGEWVSNL